MSQKEAPQRADAQRNRDRILEAALIELTRSADAPLSVIAKRAGVGQGTLYRNFDSREALVLELFRHETQQVAQYAVDLLQTHTPEVALRAWLERLAQYAMTKTGLAPVIRQVTTAPVGPANPAYPMIVAAVGQLLAANEQAGTIRRGVSPDDFLLAIAGLWQLDAHGDWRSQATRLFDLVMGGLSIGEATGR